MKTTTTILRELGREVLYSVIITDVILTIYVLWLIITNTAYWLPGVLLGYTPIGMWLLLRANKLFHLCLTHRLMLVHSFIVYCCCVYLAKIGFGCILYPMRWVMFTSGVLLIIRLIIQLIVKRYGYREHKEV